MLMTVHPAATPWPIFGRDSEWRQLETFVRDPTVKAVLVLGPAGVGKSEFLRAAHSRLAPNASLIVVHHEIESRAESSGQLLQNLAGQILSSQNLPRTDPLAIADGILKAAKDHTWAIGAAILIDAASAVAPNLKSTFESISRRVDEEVKSQSISGELQRLKEREQPDLLAGFLAVLRSVSEQGVGGVVLIDRAEASTDSHEDALNALATNMPAGWTLVLAVNDELPEGIAFAKRSWPQVAYQGGQTLQLSNLDEESVREWYWNVRHQEPNPEELQRVTRWCEGRPLMLKDWITGSATAASLRDVWKRLGPYYETRILALPENLRKLLRTLALLPSGTVFQISLISELLGVGAADAYEAAELLRSENFLICIDEELGFYRLVHDVTRMQVTVRTPKPVRGELADRLDRVLSSHPLDQLLASSARGVDYTLAQVYFDAGVSEKFRIHALPAARELVNSASVVAAGDLYGGLLELSSGLMGEDEAEEASLGLAEALLLTGQYRRGLAVIRSRGAWSAKRHPDARLLAAKLMLRLSDYSTALDDLAAAEHDYKLAGRWQGAVSARKERVTILRDLGRYDQAVTEAHALLQDLDVADSQGEFRHLRASCLRALARSLAFTGPFEDGLLAVGEARRLAIETGNQADLGNADLAEGELRRLQGYPLEARTCYRSAADRAREIGNRDSLLWSLLGDSDCAFLLGDLAAAEQGLSEVREMVEPDPTRHPLEFLHLRLSEMAVRVKRGFKPPQADLEWLLASYHELGVPWPDAYLRALLAQDPPQPKRM